MAPPTRGEIDTGRNAWGWVAGLALVLVAVGSLWLLAGCDDDPWVGDGAAPSATVESTSPPTAKEVSTSTPSRGPTPTPRAPVPESTPGAESEPQPPSGATYGPFSNSADDSARDGSWIADVRAAGHAGYDRVVVEFDGEYVPTYRVGYTPTSGPFYDIPGDVVPVEGTFFLDVWLQGTSRVDMGDDYEPVYAGPDRVRSDTSVVTEVVEIEDFEANVHWIIGMDTRNSYVVWTLDSPSRLVVDIVR